ncbi:MAG: bifunctional homocysteine S-methyltransferase/methylenetetrahydrofolate reductase [Candidatus Palauibacterales bacterium]|nr:bifunctional homocysteine S-methyltransferase/methylenetetrahydrofolate reductase [Candidatus Palauibacterales bacterium]MDP2531013.1 bifunctional homocysteine S-methyltransferase/methylenetetrahydrofolate reductase [Candidatus Palauibacterales bacterium]MDP2583456.1 bifunctional homocysteine S-methyltransferase/methylenetetrahydrofolate reductase [Candidatus Palauibacterales bacterium]
MRDFLKALEERRILLFDGAMGTEIYRRGVFINRSYDDLCRTDPGMIREIHRSYREAGADVLETNSFGANRFQLQSYGLEDQVPEINEAAAALARAVAGSELLVAGSMGPLGVRLEPFGPTSRMEARAAFREQAAALARGGVDLFVCETFSDLNELEEAVRGCRDASDLPVLAEMTIQPDGQTTYGASAVQIARELDAMGVDAMGLNCSVGPALMLEAVRDMAAITDRPIAAIPNAGLPREVQGRKMYLASPEYMASYARRLVEAGARIIGGCCGTRSEHIREMSAQVEALRTRSADGAGSAGGAGASPAEVRERGEGVVRVRSGAVEGESSTAGGATPMPLAERSAWGAKLARGERVVSVEIPSPRGADPSELLDACRALRTAGVDAVAIPDGARARMRMGVVAAAALAQRETGIEALAHYTCRDRNLLGMATDLLGAQALGIRNLLLVTGDPPKMGPYPEASAVFDVDSIGLVNLVAHLNRGEDLGGHPIGGTTSFAIGVAANPGALDLEREIERWYWKVDAGADFGVTQPVFDHSVLESFLERIERAGTRLPIVAGVWPLTSQRDAEFLNNEVPGIEVPAAVIERMRSAEASGAEAARAEGLAIARELAFELDELVQGFQLTAPAGDVDRALSVLEALEGRPAG